MSLERLRRVLRDEGEALAPAVRETGGTPIVEPLVVACAADRSDGAERALVLESVLEGYLLHYAQGRLVDTDDDDLRLLAGDHLYAVGLSELAKLGDVDAVRALADLITLCARAHAEPSSDGSPRHRAAALWLLTTLAVARGPWPGYRRVIAAAGSGAANTDDLLAEATRRAGELGVELEADAALIAFQGAAADRSRA